MLEIITGLPEGVTGVQASGTITKEDYLRVLEPLVDEARRQGRRLRFVYQFGPDFERFSGGAAWEDFRVGISAMRLFDGCAVVSDVAWIRESVGFFGMMMPCPFRTFTNAEFAEAVTWLAGLPDSRALSHRFYPEQGVVVVEPGGRLRRQDFDSLALVIDPWIESHGKLHGLVIRAHEFPGWEDLAGFMQHMRFIQDHHRKIQRVAIVADSKLADIAPPLADHFIAAEIRHFEYGDLDPAIAWAAGD